MVAVQEVFRTAGFGGLASLAKSLDSGFLAAVTKYVSQAHVLAFGLLVVVFIMGLPNGLVGDWPKLKKLLGRTQ
jgi:branched-chain amino acid transport system permease protein